MYYNFALKASIWYKNWWFFIKCKNNVSTYSYSHTYFTLIIWHSLSILAFWLNYILEQGTFSECRHGHSKIPHHFHKLCGLPVKGEGSPSLCPHCGTDKPLIEVHLELKLNRKPVIYMKQHQERKGYVLFC